MTAVQQEQLTLSERSTMNDTTVTNIFNDELIALATLARERGQGDNRRIVAVAVDLVKSLRSARQSMLATGHHGPAVDQTLLLVIGFYMDQIEGEWA